MKKKIRSLILYTSLAASALMAGYMLLTRFFTLQEVPIFDELFSMSTATPSIPFKTVWTTVLLQDVNLPLYNFILRAWAHCVPFTVPWLRVLSVFFSVCTIPLAWWAAPKKWDTFKKFVFCSLLSGSFVLTAFSNLLRAYPLGVLICCVESLLALRLLENLQTKTSPSRLLFYGFFGLGFACAYTHYFCAALFFITALWLFINALIYKTQRVQIFTATAVVFLFWVPWVVATYLSLDHFQQDWWFQTPLLSASWQIFELLLGPASMLVGTVLFVAFGIISVSFHAKNRFADFQEVWMGLFQWGLLILTVSLVSLRYNLWTDRYFVFFLPSLFLILTSLLAHLTKRNVLFILLLPLTLYIWVTYSWENWQLRIEDNTGLEVGMKHASEIPGVSDVLFVYDPVEYKGSARFFITEYFIPKGSNIKLIPLTHENEHRIHEHVPVVVPLCSMISLLNYSTKYNFTIPNDVFAHNGTCVVML